MDGDQFGSVGKRGFDLHLGNHVRDTIHDIIAGE